jgi:hypothetical protein
LTRELYLKSKMMMKVLKKITISLLIKMGKEIQK